MQKFKFIAVAVAIVSLLWMCTPEEETSPYLEQNIVEKPAPRAVSPAQDLIDSGSIPALSHLKSDEAKKRDTLLATTPSSTDPAPMVFPTQPIKISTKRGLLPLTAGIAKTKAEWEAGMMFYRQWPADKMHGLLFIFKDPIVLTMWMKNTYIPLDILFMNAEGIISNIHEQAQPLREDTVASAGAAMYVLELPAGAARKWQIEEGDRLIYTENGL